MLSCRDRWVKPEGMLKITNVGSGWIWSTGQGVQQSSTVQIISLLCDVLCLVCLVQGWYTRHRYPHQCALLFLRSQACVSTLCAYLCLLQSKLKCEYPAQWLVVHHQLCKQVPAFKSPYLILSYSKTSIDSWTNKHYVSANTSCCYTSCIKPH